MNRIHLLTAQLVVLVAGVTALRGAPPQVQIAEVLAGANGDSKGQFIELKFCCAGENLWGPQSGESVGRYRLVFYDATGAQTGQFVFPSDAPIGLVDPVNGGYSVLIATQPFANLPGMPAPNFIIPTNVIAQGGKVCFKNNPSNPNAQAVNLCLSYGNFVGSTESDTMSQPAGAPTTATPIVDASSLTRTANHANYGVGQFNADFALAAAAPRNSAGQTGTITPAAQVAQGQKLFVSESFLGNGRTCATCHRPEADFSLPVSLIATLPPSDALFVAETNPALAALENPCLLRGRGLFLENIDGFANPHVFRGSPHIENTLGTAPYGLSGGFATLQLFATGAVQQHLPKTMARNANPALGPMDFRLPTGAELAAMEAFMHSIKLPADGNYDLDRMITAAIQRGADGAAINRGRALFFGEVAKCFLCHSGPVLAEADALLGGGFQSFDTGVVDLPINQSEPCLGGAPMPPEQGGNREFNTPALIGVVSTAPYFHDHSVQTLRESVAFYDETEFNNSPAGLLIEGIALLESEIDDLTAFLSALVEPTVTDCNNNMVDDVLDVSQGTSLDCNIDGVPDECQLAGNDCNTNLIPDNCDIQPVKYASATNWPVGDGPFAVAAVDLNADGRADLVSSNWNAATASVWLSNAGVGFISAGSFTVGPQGKYVATGDFDQDGDPDVAIPSLGQAKVYVLRNNGVSGTWQGFAPFESFTTGAGPLSIAVADLNGDTRPDMATADTISGTISILLNNGSSMGTWQGFAAPVSYAAGSSVWYITAGRLDADADIDLAIVNRLSFLPTAKVFWNNGSGVFSTSVSIGVGITPESVAIGDFNLDGKNDLAVANFDANTVSISTNLGAGSFSPDIEIGVGFYPFGSNPKYIQAFDAEGDGDLDLATANEFSDNVSLLINNGSGTFNKLVNLPAPDAPAGLGIGDVNNDGKPDIVTSHYVQDRLSVIVNLSPPFGGDCNGNVVPDSCDIASDTVTDFNGNGVPDGCEKLGDIDKDRDLDALDVDLFVAVLLGSETTPAYVTASDIDASGSANGSDIRPFVRLFIAGL